VVGVGKYLGRRTAPAPQEGVAADQAA